MSKELSPLKALQVIKNSDNARYYCVEIDIIEYALKEMEKVKEHNIRIYEELQANETKLKALQIIKEKRVRVPFLQDLLKSGLSDEEVLEEYNANCDEITKDEYDLLKEVLL